MAREKQFIDESTRVYCGSRGEDVDIETCLGCRRLVTYDLDCRRPYIVCRASEDVEIRVQGRGGVEIAV